MKSLLIASLCLFSISAMAESVKDVVARMEATHEVSCSKVDQTMKKCMNTACMYTNIYACSSEVDSFGMKVKVLEYTGMDSERKIEARGVTLDR